jgi:hypothetical protein
MDWLSSNSIQQDDILGLVISLARFLIYDKSSQDDLAMKLKFETRPKYQTRPVQVPGTWHWRI